MFSRLACNAVFAAAKSASLSNQGAARASLPSRLALGSVLSLAAPHRASLCTTALAAEGPGSMAGLEESRIIPDLIDRVAAASSAELEVAYTGKAVQSGEVIAPDDAASTPRATIKGGSEGGLFTLICTDPDPPDPANPKMKEWLHWVVTNIPASGDASKGNEVTHYRGPAPPIGTHRYVFLLFQQPNQEPLQVQDPSGGDPMGRAKFSTKKFAQAHNLGDPVAVTWFKSHK